MLEHLLQSATDALAYQPITERSTSDLVQVLSYQASGLDTALTCLAAPLTCVRYCLVRMDLPLECYNFDEELPAIQSAIILYNYGVAQLLRDQTQDPSGAGFVRAVKLFKLAGQTVATGSELTYDIFQRAGLLHLGLLVLHGNIQACLRTADHSEVACLFDKYQTVREAVERLHGMLHWCHALISSAPAA